jgi:hypothetical protein
MSVDESASVSTVSSNCGANSIHPALFKSIRKDIRKIKNSKEMIEFAFENEEVLSQLPTRLLNIWQTIKGWRFMRHSGRVSFTRQEKDTVRTLQEDVEELRTIVSRIIKFLNMPMEDEAI